VITFGYCDTQNRSIRYRERSPFPSHLARRRRERTSRQRYAVTGVSRGIGTEIAMALRSRGHRVAGFDVAQFGLDDFIHLDLSDTASIISAAPKISPLHALIG